MGRTCSRLAVRMGTMLILTLSPPWASASMPSSTVSRSPPRAMSRKRRGSSVSRLTLIRRRPDASRRSILRSTSWPFVVMATSSTGRAMSLGSTSSNFGESRGSPPVTRSCSMPAASTMSSTAYASSSPSSSCCADCRRFPSGTQ